MKNIIKFDIDGDHVITHNGLPFTDSEVSCIDGINTICIKGNNFIVKNITMFNLGKDEIIKFGKHLDNTWVLEYEYPVFPWLHKMLNHGWLIKKD